ncbi:hypothetical protein C8R45DRAFT_510545 [Mycena sanguinolenta]|nr:hypothetical protein C8R45DRAFT_510545 [Mycena sanguinolenta]
MLASLRSYNRKKFSSKSPFSLKRADPESPHPYATQVFDIGDSRSSFEAIDHDTASTSRVHDPLTKLHPVEPVVPPRVEIDIDLTPADWFPAHFLKSDSIAGPSDSTSAANAIAPSATASQSVDTLEPDDASYEEDEELSEASEDLAPDLKALDDSNFGNIPEADGLILPTTHLPRKAVPNASLRGPRVQLLRSSTVQSTFPFDGESAASGTTLARALIGDSFILSNDRSSKYWSGASVLTRSDSATLPRGEHPFSPAWTRRKSGGFTPVDTLGMAVPPLPQMPEELRHAIAESRDKLKADEVSQRASPLRSGSDGRTLSTGDQNVRPVSRISEAPTPSSAAPDTPNPSATNSAPNTDPSPNTSNFHAGASPASFPTSPDESTASDVRDLRDIDGVLDYYNLEPSPGYPNGQSTFDMPSPNVAAESNRFHPAFSPITEETSSQLSPNSFPSRQTTGKVSLASTPSPGG